MCWKDNIRSSSFLRKQGITLFCVFLSHVTCSQNWTSLGGGTDNITSDCYADTINNLLLISGSFEFAGNTRVNQVAIWDGVSWSPIGIGSGDTSCNYGCESITKILIYDSLVCVSGSHRMMGGDLNNQYLSKFDSNSWSAFGSPQNGAKVWRLGNELFAFPIDDSLSGNPISVVAKWDGTQWLDFTSPLPTNSALEYFSCAANFQGEHVFGGNFDVSGQNFHEIVLWDGADWWGLADGVQGNAWVNDMMVYKDHLWVGGYFSEADGNVADFLMVWNGQQWFDPFPGVQFTSQVKDLEVIDEELYIVGAHYAFADTGYYGLARYDGTFLRSFGGSSNYPEKVAGLDGEIYVITNKVFAGDTVNYIAQWIGGDSVDYTYYAALDIQEATNNEIKVFPNPAQAALNVQFSDRLMNPISVQLYDLQGRLVREETILSGRPNHTIAVEELQSGLYILAVGQFIERVVVK